MKVVQQEQNAGTKMQGLEVVAKQERRILPKMVFMSNLQMAHFLVLSMIKKVNTP